jgi:hypothetical protein
MTVELDMTPEQETVVSKAAAQEGVSVAELLAQTAAYLFSEEARERGVLLERIADADRGDFLNEDEVEARFQKMLRH